MDTIVGLLGLFVFGVVLLIAVFLFVCIISGVEKIIWMIRRPRYVKVEHYGEKIWVDRKMELKRKDNCMCLKCKRLENCPFAKQFLEICKKANCAFIMTRCREWEKND